MLLSGEAGIGKSRLTAALMERLEGESHTRLRYFCSPQHTDSALYPVIGQMERAAGLAHGDTAKAKLDKLDALLAQTSTSAQDVSLIADMLSLPNDKRYPLLDMTPEQRRQKTLEALGSQMEALSRSNPVLMIFEDTHWVDPTSLEVLSRVVDRLRNLRVLLLVTFRPEFEPPWIGRPYVTALILNRLAQRDIETVIDNVVGNKLIPASIRQDIIERTDGIPLFVEEMTKAVLEAGSEGAAQQTAASIPSPTLAVPASLQASLTARLDRLGTAKEVAQIGAAIGREFSHTLLSAVVSKSEPELLSLLEGVIEAGLLLRQGVPPHATYLFKHALVQDAAYGSLLREPRRALHARIAETLENQFREIADSQPELLARHCTEAGLIERAAELWGKAGQRSLERSALVEAAEQVTRAINQLATLASTEAIRRERIRLQIALTNALMHTKGFSAAETKTALDQAQKLIEQAEELGERPEDPLPLFSTLYGFWAVNFVAFDGNALRVLAERFLSLAQKQEASSPRMIGHRLMGTSLVFAGDFAEGRAHYDQALAIYDPTEHHALATLFGQDLKVVILSNRSWALWPLGYPMAALKDIDHALKHARDVDHVATLMYALNATAFSLNVSGNYAVATSLADELILLARQKGSSLWEAGGQAHRNCALSSTGKASSAVEGIASAINAWRSTGATVWIPWWLSQLASAYLELGQFDKARRCINEATMAIETTEERLCEAEVNRIAGEITRGSPQPDAAEAQIFFERAITIARQQQAKSWELRASMSLARLWRDQGKRDEARELLAPVYGWFTEGFDTRDLKEAKALLDEVAAR